MPPIALHPLPTSIELAPWWRTWAARVAAVFGSAPRPPSSQPFAAAEGAHEREALCGLSEHVLKDIGASSRLVAHAAECARDSVASRLDIGW